MKENEVGVMSPSSVLDWKWDWSKWLVDGDTIVSFTVVGNNVTVDSSHKSDDDTAVIAFLSSPTKSRVSAVCQIVSTQGLHEPRTLRIQVRGR